jgi:hypothetical protein
LRITRLSAGHEDRALAGLGTISGNYERLKYAVRAFVVPIEQIQTVSFAAMYTRRGHMLDWRELSG